MTASKLIDSLGGTGKVAGLCGLSASAVSCWRERGIPRAWKLHLESLRPKSVIIKQKQK